MNDAQSGASAAEAEADAPFQEDAELRPTPAKKATPRKAAAKKATAKKTPAKKTAPKRTRTPRRSADASAASAAKYPRHTVEQALRIPRAIYQQNAGRPATPLEAVKYAGGTGLSGALNVEISSAKKYGFLEPVAEGRLGLTQRARRAIAPQSNSDGMAALQEAVMAAPDISAVYNFYRGENLPDSQYFVNALIDRFKIPPDKVDDFRKIFMESLRSAELIDDSGTQPRLINAGRDEAHRPAAGKSAPKANVAAGTTCFVMQPFVVPLGTYYETIYRPAIEQAGLEPVRADDSIFGAGKIIDQVWRGIRAAKVLIAELTTRNPNVFYELGLAHALAKPVILVSSNDEDVPFDLRHLRYIRYDQSDPFWGQKLIDKIADNIKLAISDPEEAIFPLGDL